MYHDKGLNAGRERSGPRICFPGSGAGFSGERRLAGPGFLQKGAPGISGRAFCPELPMRQPPQAVLVPYVMPGTPISRRAVMMVVIMPTTTSNSAMTVIRKNVVVPKFGTMRNSNMAMTNTSAESP